VDKSGNTLYCFMNADGAQSPTLYVQPGDQLILTVKNLLPPSSSTAMKSMPEMVLTGPPSSACGATTMTASSVNVHYHGANVPPTCHQDEVIFTMINSGQTFTYNLYFPKNEPPGLYWYHPHIHGIAEASVLGGASGAIIVQGIQNVNPAVAGLAQRILVVRDNPVPGSPRPGGPVPSKDLSLNYIPVPYPNYPPVQIPMKPSEKQFWRVLNASADTILDLQVLFNGAAQTLEVVALDGVPTFSQDGSAKGKSILQTDVLIPPAGRAEFIVTAPASAAQSAILMTKSIDTGPYGDHDIQRPLAAIQLSDSAPRPPVNVPVTSAASVRPPSRFAGLATAAPTAQRTLYFSENGADFYITVDGQKPTLFSPNNPPAIVTTQGAVEDWVIQNRSLGTHAFHIHQLHFLLLAVNGTPVKNGQFFDTIQIPYWSGTGPYPSVKVRMDFRGPTVGDFVYHCHILSHEDLGMMAIIRVNPATGAEADAVQPSAAATPVPGLDRRTKP
jgi:FtsP/CotA-like multicopper oxidase with cupredoxin domain